MTARTAARAELLAAEVRAVLHHLDPAPLAGRRLFVTGGTGFFGLWLLTALHCLNQDGVGIQVEVLSRDPGAFLQRNPVFDGASWLRFVQGDVRRFSPAQPRFDLLIHAAAETSLAAHAQPQVMFDTIVDGSRHTIEAARQGGVRRMLLVSSGAVYGSQPDGVDHVADDSQQACSPLRASSAYGEGKRVMELLGTLSGIDTVVARCFAFSGPGLPLEGHFAIGNFVRDALWAEQITVQGDGTAVRSYLHGADLAVWLLKLLASGAPGHAYNVGSDEALTIEQLARLVSDTLSPGKPVRVAGEMGPGSQASPRQRYVPGIDKARLELGCAPWTTLPASLRSMARFAGL